MRILMLGNSFTYFHELPGILSGLTGWEVVSNTKGGAYLSEQFDESSETGKRAMKLLREEKWDYVVLQEQSFYPVGNREGYLKSVRELSILIRENGAVPVIYESWAYREGSRKLSGTGLTYAEMLEKMVISCETAARENGAVLARVGEAFDGVRDVIGLYEADDYHPAEAGSAIAAGVIRRSIEEHAAGK